MKKLVSAAVLLSLYTLVTAQLPVITFINPSSPETIYNSDLIQIKAEIRSTYELQHLSITINGNESVIQPDDLSSQNDSTYTFTKSIHLKPGRNIVYLTVANAKGLTISAKNNIYFGIASLRLGNNSIYGTVGLGPIYGNLIGNYEHSVYESTDKFFSSIRIRIGVGPWVSWEIGGLNYVVTFQALSGRWKDHFEIGTGVVLMQKLWPAGNLGYRFQKPGGPGLFRIGIGWPEAVYLSLGFCF